MQGSSPQVAEGRSAVHRDPETRIHEEAMYFGPEVQKMFGFLRVPDGDVRGGVVLCPPVHEDFMRVYRKEVLLSRALAARGLAVFSFHYRGTGNSEGDVGDLTYDRMLDDTEVAMHWLTERIGTVSALVGIRWGGLMAAAATRGTRTPLALWEPTLDPVDYFREATRARTVWQLREGLGPSSRGPFEEELRREGSVDLLGYPVYLGLYETSRGHTLVDELGDLPRSLLLVQMTRSERLRDRYASLSRRLGEHGSTVEGHVLEGEESWWFTGVRWEPEEDRGGTHELIGRTTDWVVRQAGEHPS